MRVLQVNSFFYERAGAEAHLVDLLDLLDEAGHEVSVMAMDHPSNLHCRWPHAWLPYVPHEPGLGPRAAARAFGRSIYSATVARRVEAFARRMGVEIAHLHGVHGHLSLSVLDGLRNASVPVVWTLHDYRSVCPASSLLRDGRPCEACSDGAFWHALLWRCRGGSAGRSLAVSMESYLTAWTARYQNVSCFISPSRFLARKVLAMGLPARRMEVLPNFLRYEPSPSSRDRSGILFVGRLSREKGVDTLIRAVTQVPQVQLTVIGDGPERLGLQSLARSLDARVTFLGWLERNRVLDTMRHSELLCVPSVWYENCPLVVLEAMGSGLPFAVSDIGGLPELAMGGECGSIVPLGSVDRWAAVMRKVRANPEELRDCAEHAAISLRERHDPKAFVGRLAELYRDAAVDDTRFSLRPTSRW